MKNLTVLIIALFVSNNIWSQRSIPIDTTHWEINARSYVLENYKGKDAIYLQTGSMTLKDSLFLNGTIEFDLYLKETQGFPGLYFRSRGNSAEQWYIRPHLSGKPDANQAAASINGVTPWQLLFGTKYSFPYTYNYNGWTHVKLVVKDDKAQVFLDNAETPHLSWNLFLPNEKGTISFRGGNREALHIADIKIDKDAHDLIDFKPIKNKPIDGLVKEWEVSDKFEEKLLADPTKISSVIKNRKWGRKIQLEEGKAANISRVQMLRNENPGETVFAKIEIHSEKDQIKLFHFGYSDRVVAVLNGEAIYKGNNGWRTRDYRYLGTIGLFDGIYLNLKKGKNTLLMAVSESFGGWLITGKFEDLNGIEIK